MQISEPAYLEIHETSNFQSCDKRTRYPSESHPGLGRVCSHLLEPIAAIKLHWRSLENELKSQQQLQGLEATTSKKGKISCSNWIWACHTNSGTAEEKTGVERPQVLLGYTDGKTPLHCNFSVWYPLSRKLFCKSDASLLKTPGPTGMGCDLVHHINALFGCQSCPKKCELMEYDWASDAWPSCWEGSSGFYNRDIRRTCGC